MQTVETKRRLAPLANETIAQKALPGCEVSPEGQAEAVVIETILPNNSDTDVVTTATNGVEDNVFKRSEVMVIHSPFLGPLKMRSNTMAGRNSDTGIALVKGKQ